MRITHCYLAATFLGLAAILTLGCDNSTGPTTGAIAVTVSTAGANIDLDPDGYTLSIDGGPGQAVAVNAAVTIADLPTGNHLVRLDGLAPNCSVSGTNPRSVDVIASSDASSPVSFSVSCMPQPQPSTSQAFIWTRESGMIALPLLPGTTESYASAINDPGQVVGHVRIGNRYHAFVWTLAGGMVDIGGLSDAIGSYATAINNGGQVVGYSINASNHAHAFRWSPAEGMIALGVLPGTVNSYARGISGSGQVVGESEGTLPGRRPFRWTPENGAEDLGLFGSDPDGGAIAVSNSGDIVGFSGDGDYYGIVRAVLWSANGEKRVIYGCTTPGFYGCYSSANAINSAGQIAGSSEAHAFRWTVAGVAQDLGTLPGSNLSYARGINEAGQVVGNSAGGSFPSGHAFLWSPAGGMVDLGVLGGRGASYATGINNYGQVVGTSQ